MNDVCGQVCNTDDHTGLLKVNPSVSVLPNDRFVLCRGRRHEGCFLSSVHYLMWSFIRRLLDHSQGQQEPSGKNRDYKL